MPPNFNFPENQRLWVTIQPWLFRDARDRRYLFTFGRLRAGTTQQRALEDLNAIAARLDKEYPATNAGWRARIRTLHQAYLPDDVMLILGLMMAGVTLVLFIACSNVANRCWRVPPRGATNWRCGWPAPAARAWSCNS